MDFSDGLKNLESGHTKNINPESCSISEFFKIHEQTYHNLTIHCVSTIFLDFCHFCSLSCWQRFSLRLTL